MLRSTLYVKIICFVNFSEKINISNLFTNGSINFLLILVIQIFGQISWDVLFVVNNCNLKHHFDVQSVDYISYIKELNEGECIHGIELNWSDNNSHYNGLKYTWNLLRSYSDKFNIKISEPSMEAKIYLRFLKKVHCNRIDVQIETEIGNFKMIKFK